jgi:hypothetical protein
MNTWGRGRSAEVKIHLKALASYFEYLEPNAQQFSDVT